MESFNLLLVFLSFPFTCFCWLCGCIRRLDVYIYDHLVKKKLHNIAKSFMTEGKVSLDHVGKGKAVSLFQWELNSLEFICCLVLCE